MPQIVICRHCKKESLETNDNYNPDAAPNGTMFSVIPGVKVRQAHHQWPSIKGQNFPCPMCMMPIPDMWGKVALKEIEVEKPVFKPPSPIVTPTSKVKKPRKRRQKKGS